MANRGIAQRTLGDVPYSGSGGVGDCPRLVRPKNDFRETPGPRIDRIPPTRPPWWHRQYRELKKLIFSAPGKCPIDLFGPLANRTILKQLHGVTCFLVCLQAASSVGWGLQAVRSNRERYTCRITPSTCARVCREVASACTA